MKNVGLLFFLFLASCAHSVHQVHTSDFMPGTPIASGDMVRASSQQTTFLGFVNDTNYVNQAYQELMSKCQSGQITGITTQYSTSLGFFSWTNKILMQGLCVKNN